MSDKVIICGRKDYYSSDTKVNNNYTSEEMEVLKKKTWRKNKISKENKEAWQIIKLKEPCSRNEPQ